MSVTAPWTSDIPNWQLCQPGQREVHAEKVRAWGGCLPEVTCPRDPKNPRAGYYTIPKECHESPAQKAERATLIAQIKADEAEAAMLEEALYLVGHPEQNDEAAQAAAEAAAAEVIAAIEALPKRARDAAFELPGMAGGLKSFVKKNTRSISKAAERIGDALESLPGQVSRQLSRDWSFDPKKLWDRVENEFERASRKALRSLAQQAGLQLGINILTFALAPTGVGTLVGMLAQQVLNGTTLGTNNAVALGILAPEQANKLVAEMAKLVAQVDVLDTLPGMALQELAVQAQSSQERRDALRRGLAELKASLMERGGPWIVAAQAAWSAIETAAITYASAGAASALALQIQLAKAALSASQQALALQAARETIRSFESLAKAEQAKADAALAEAEQAEMARLDAEIEALRSATPHATGGEGGPTVTPPAPAVGRPSFWDRVIRTFEPLVAAGGRA